MTAVELEHCREAAIKAGSLFEFTSRYLPADRFEEYLALYALVQTIHLISNAHVDESVMWAKLKWWNEELAAEPGSVSRHPVLRALWVTGARAKFDKAAMQGLVSGAVERIDMAPDSDENDMFERLARLGSATIELELALDDAAIDGQSMKYLGAASGVFDVLSSFGKDKQLEFDRIPLSILAGLNLNAKQLEQQPGELEQVIAQLAGLGQDWFSEGMSGLNSLKKNRAGKHLQLRWAMENRCLKNIRKNAAGYLEAGNRYGPADAWFAWRYLRGLN